MYIEDKLFSETSGERYYSVAMTEEEYDLFSEFQKRFSKFGEEVKALRKFKKLYKTGKELEKAKDWAEKAREAGLKKELIAETVGKTMEENLAAGRKIGKSLKSGASDINTHISKKGIIRQHQKKGLNKVCGYDMSDSMIKDEIVKYSMKRR